jgi:phospho-N-acetylmuramoyl-pentapeptide-transferase
MLIWLVDRFTALWPESAWSATLNSFAKITFRTALATLASFVLAILLGPRVISWLRARFREPPCGRTPELRELHRHKAATPTMGGLFLVTGIVVAAILLCSLKNVYVPIVLLNVVCLAAIGAVDDLKKLSGQSTGLSVRKKLAAQFAVATVVTVWLYAVQHNVPGGTDLQIPIAGISLPLGFWFVPLAMFVIVGSSNAVNLTDGLDGLAGGCLITTTAAMAGVAYIAGHAELAGYLGVTHLPEAGETVVIAGAMIGGTLGFLWFNCQPAQVFMGDTGSLSLGGTLGLIAVIAGQELVLLVIGAVFVVEAASVILQVGSCRWRGRRVFRCAPLHHHFQLLGWAENKIVTRFWIVSMLSALVGLGMMKMNRGEEPTNRQRPEAIQVERQTLLEKLSRAE